MEKQHMSSLYLVSAITELARCTKSGFCPSSEYDATKAGMIVYSDTHDFGIYHDIDIHKLDKRAKKAVKRLLKYETMTIHVAITPDDNYVEIVCCDFTIIVNDGEWDIIDVTEHVDNNTVKERK